MAQTPARRLTLLTEISSRLSAETWALMNATPKAFSIADERHLEKFIRKPHSQADRECVRAFSIYTEDGRPRPSCTGSVAHTGGDAGPPQLLCVTQKPGFVSLLDVAPCPV
jgi:hypothetical protein